MNAQQVLAQFAATGVQTCFHDRHIEPQIYAGLNGSNWQLKDYEARGGYAALRKILGADGKLMDGDFLNIKHKLPPLKWEFDEEGLLGIAFPPDFKKTGKFYISYTAQLRGDAFDQLVRTGRRRRRAQAFLQPPDGVGEARSVDRLHEVVERALLEDGDVIDGRVSLGIRADVQPGMAFCDLPGEPVPAGVTVTERALPGRGGASVRGSIQASSSPGRGSTFTVRIPVDISPAQRARA